MDDAERDRRFAELLNGVIERHAVASRLQRTVDLAETTLTAALRVGDAVRRSLRAAGGERPDDDDCRRLDELARQLEDATDLVLAAPPAPALRQAAAAGHAEEAARFALELFAGLARPAAIPDAVYVGLTVRRRARAGETLVHYDALAREIVRYGSDGVAPASGDAAPEDGALLPEPIALAQTFAGAGSEIALRRTTGDLHDALLEDVASSDLVLFADRLRGPFSVVLAREADDEWWAASSTSYASYSESLIRALAAVGVAAEVRDV